MQAVEESVKVPGATLFGVLVGDPQTRDVCVLLHGGPGASHDYMRPQMDALSGPRRALYYYDQRGSGRSELEPGVAPGGFEDHIADLDRVREHLGRERLTLVGYSWGAMLALLYTTRHPERVERLALVSPGPPRAKERDLMRERLRAASLRPEVDALKASIDPTDARQRFAVVVAGYFLDPKLALGLTPFKVKARAEQAVWASMGDYDLEPQLISLWQDASIPKPPCFIAHGIEDPVPIDGARRIARITSAELIEIPHCGHVPYVEAPEIFFPAINRFLDQTVSG